MASTDANPHLRCARHDCPEPLPEPWPKGGPTSASTQLHRSSAEDGRRLRGNSAHYRWGGTSGRFGVASRPLNRLPKRMTCTISIGCAFLWLLVEAVCCRESKNVQDGVQSHPPAGRERRRILRGRLCTRGPSAHGLVSWAEGRDPFPRWAPAFAGVARVNQRDEALLIVYC